MKAGKRARLLAVAIVSAAVRMCGSVGPAYAAEPAECADVSFHLEPFVVFLCEQEAFDAVQVVELVRVYAAETDRDRLADELVAERDLRTADRDRFDTTEKSLRDALADCEAQKHPLPPPDPPTLLEMPEFWGVTALVIAATVGVTYAATR